MAFDRLPVAALDRAGELEAVLDRPAHQRVERLGRRARCLEQRARGPTERDEVVGGDRGARVVRRAILVEQRERTEPEYLGEPARNGARLVALAGHRRPGAVELLRPAPQRERLQRMEAESLRVRGECRERRRAADVRDPWPRGNVGRRLRDHAVGDTEEHEIGISGVEPQAALHESRGYRRADSAGTDHVDVVHHVSLLQFLGGYRAWRAVYRSDAEEPQHRRGDLAQAGAIVTGMPLRTALPESGSTTDASVRAFTLTPGRPAATD